MNEASKDSDTMFDDSTLEDALDEVIRLARKHRGAEIDAGACGTRTDFDNMRKAEESFHDAKDAFLARFAGEVGALEAEQRKVAGLMAALKQATSRINAIKAAIE